MEKTAQRTKEFAIKVNSPYDYETAIEKVTDYLKEEGFGILTEIDVKEAIKKKLDLDFKRYKILGVCNPNYAHKALSQEDLIGVFLPCNVVVYEEGSGFGCRCHESLHDG